MTVRTDISAKPVFAEV